MDAKFVQDAVTLLVVIDPIGVAPVYLALTCEMERAQRLRVALRACAIAALILIAFIGLGEVVLYGLGVHLPSFRIAGGLVLLLVGLRIALGMQVAPTATSASGDVASFPLASPVIAGPGAIIAAVLLTENERFSVGEQAMTGVVVMAIMALTYVVLACADMIQKVIGATGATVLSRVLGLVLASLAMQTMLDGLRPYLASIR